jgi:hypothetical protein
MYKNCGLINMPWHLVQSSVVKSYDTMVRT